MKTPYFSIVIPTFNREREVGRAIDSCLAQEFAEFELTVVDGCSTDRTAAIVAAYEDPRVKLLRHTVNRGVCPARNAGVRAALAPWIVFLDSDHEMRPGCLSRAFEVASSAGPEIGRFGFMYDFDDGRTSPDPLPESDLDYLRWLRWIDHLKWSDALWITRRQCFDTVMMPETFAMEFSYHLDFARQFRSRILPERFGIQHTDGTSRLSLGLQQADPNNTQDRKLADQLEDWTDLLRNHGQALKEYAPRRYAASMRMQAAFSVLAKRRSRGIAAAASLVRMHPASVKNWALLFFTLLGAGPTQWAVAYRKRRQEELALKNSVSRCGVPLSTS